MKKSILVVVILGSLFQMQAQDFVVEAMPDTYERIPVDNTVIHSEYVKTIEKKNVPMKAAHFQKLLAAWDITDDNSFDGRKDIFEAIFKGPSVYVRAYFTSNGTLASTNEMYRNVALPKNIQKKLYTEYPGWKQSKNKYHVLYVAGETMEAIYSVTLRKEGKKKVLRFNSDKSL